MKFNNLNKDKIKKLGSSVLITATLGTVALGLSGCNATVIDTKMTFNKAIIFSDNNATIVEVKSWTDYDGEQFQIKTPDGITIVTSSYDTKLIDDRNSKISAEDLAKCIMGEDVTINYLNDENQKTR